MTACVMLEAAGPMITSAPSASRRLTASIAITGFVAESAPVRVTSPPAALMSAMARKAASRAGAARGASGPVSGCTAPIWSDTTVGVGVGSGVDSGSTVGPGSAAGAGAGLGSCAGADTGSGSFAGVESAVVGAGSVAAPSSRPPQDAARNSPRSPIATRRHLIEISERVLALRFSSRACGGAQ